MNPLSSTEFLVIEFDHGSGQLAVLDDVGYMAGESTRTDAGRRAQEAAMQAAAKGLDRSYVVVRVGTESSYSSMR